MESGAEIVERYGSLEHKKKRDREQTDGEVSTRGAPTYNRRRHAPL